MFYSLSKQLLLFLVFSETGFSLQKSPLFERNDLMTLCGKHVNLLRQKWFQRTVPQLNQGPTGLCYAHAAASYFDLWKIQHLNNLTTEPVIDISLKEKMNTGKLKFSDLNIKKAISSTNPLWLSYLYSRDRSRKKSKFDGGISEETLEKILKGYGSCRSDVIKKTLQKFTKKNHEIISAIEFYALTSWIINHHKRITEIVSSNKHWQTKFSEVIERHPQNNLFQKVLENGNFKKIYQSLEPFVEDKDYKSYFEKVFKSCLKEKNWYPESKSPELNHYKICSHYDAHGFDRMEIILKLLDRKEPVIFSYHSEILSNREVLGKAMPEPGDHSSIIVGKRVRNDRCELLVQNSWGNYCDYGWPCQKDEYGREMGIWVDSWYLIRQTSDLSYLEHKNESCFPSA